MKNILLLLLFYFLAATGSLQAQNYVLVFDGEDDYVDLPIAVQPSETNFTAEAWVYLSPGGGPEQKILFNQSNSGNVRGYALTVFYDGDGYYYCPSIYINGQSFFTPKSHYIPTNTWIHLAMTWEVDGEISSFINGQLIGSSSTAGAGAYQYSGSNTSMGGADGGTWGQFKGKIDEIRLWNSTRTQTELSSNRYTSFIGNEAGLISYYKMSNGSGPVLSDNTSYGYYEGELKFHVSWEMQSTLPLSFISFTGQSHNGGIQLNWITQGEVNNNYFELQHSADGIGFSKLTTVPSKGSTTGKQQYTFVDMQPFAGFNYYRLKQVDKDGRATFSTIIKQVAENNTVTLRIINNPVTNGQLKIQLNKEATVAISNSTGNLVQTIPLLSGTQLIDVSRFKKGVYSIKTGSQAQQFIIQ